MILLLSHSLGVVTGQNKTEQHAPRYFFCRPFLSLIISILVPQPLLLNYSHNTCSLNSARSFNLACLFEVGQEAYCTICKFNLQGSTYKNSTNKVLRSRTTFKRWSRYSPTSSQARVLVKQASIAAYLTRFTVDFFSYDSLNARKQKKYYR